MLLDEYYHISERIQTTIVIINVDLITTLLKISHIKVNVAYIIKANMAFEMNNKCMCTLYTP